LTRVRRCFPPRRPNIPVQGIALGSYQADSLALTGNAVEHSGPWIPRLTAGATPRASYGENARPRPTGVCARHSVKRGQKCFTAFPDRAKQIVNWLPEFCPFRANIEIRVRRRSEGSLRQRRIARWRCPTRNAAISHFAIFTFLRAWYSHAPMCVVVSRTDDMTGWTDEKRGALVRRCGKTGGNNGVCSLWIPVSPYPRLLESGSSSSPPPRIVNDGTIGAGGRCVTTILEARKTLSDHPAVQDADVSRCRNSPFRSGNEPFSLAAGDHQNRRSDAAGPCSFQR